MSKPYSRKEVIGDCELYLGDCLDVMKILEPVDAVVTDPPYGIGESKGRNKSRSVLATSKDYGDSDWDNEPANREQIEKIIAMSRHQIIFGGNYFEGLGPTKCWLVWDKKNGANDFADCELAWTNLSKAVRRIEWQWHGMIRKGSDIRQHPTQKPFGVMVWCLEQLPHDAQTIMDPFAGSGTTGVACLKLGRKFIGIEKDPKYFEIMVERIQKAADQPDLFVSKPDPEIQEAMEL